MKHFSDFLCEYEKLEILKYDYIYYISDMRHKINASAEVAYADDKYEYHHYNVQINLCYRGDYKVIRNDHVAYRYEIIDMLGRGSFGQVQTNKLNNFKCKNRYLKYMIITRKNMQP